MPPFPQTHQTINFNLPYFTQESPSTLKFCASTGFRHDKMDTLYSDADLVFHYPLLSDPWGHAVVQLVESTALQAGRSRVRFPMVSLEFLLLI